MMTISEAKRKLKKMGCRFYDHGTRHDWWINPKNGKKTQLGRHDSQELKTGTWEKIKKQLGLR